MTDDLDYDLDYDPALVAWLRAQLDADEDLARSAAATPFNHPLQAPWEDARIRFRGSQGSSADLAVAVFANPSWVLADIAAKRKLIDELIEFMEGDHAPWNDGYLKLLAQPYADREGFRDEWRYVEVVD